MYWKFPLNGNIEVPIGNHPGAFGAERKHDWHTGVDLYCEPDSEVFAVEDGEVVVIEVFTGEELGQPWWNETYAVMVEGKTGVVNYGEITPESFELGRKVKRGDKIGKVIPVLRPEKLRKDIPGHSTSMLHLELYEKGHREFAEWLDDPWGKPKGLLDPTWYLMMAKTNKFYDEHPEFDVFRQADLGIVEFMNILKMTPQFLKELTGV